MVCGLGSGSEHVGDPHLLGEQPAELRGIAPDVGLAEILPHRVRDHVCTPGRIGDEADAVCRLGRRAEPPALEVGARVIDVPYDRARCGRQTVIEAGLKLLRRRGACSAAACGGP